MALLSHIGHAHEADIEIEMEEPQSSAEEENSDENGDHDALLGDGSALDDEGTKKNNNKKNDEDDDDPFGKTLKEDVGENTALKTSFSLMASNSLLDHPNSPQNNKKKKKKKSSNNAQINDANHHQHQKQRMMMILEETIIFFLPRQLQLLLRDNRINSWFAEESQQIDRRAMAEMHLADFFICSSHKTYLSGPQFGAMSVSPEMIAHCLLREACRCIEIDCWEGKKGAPIVTNGGMTSASSPLTDILMVVQRCAFARTSYPLIIILGVHGGFDFQQKIAVLFKDYFGRHLLRANKVEKYIERNKPMTLESLRGKILLVANVSAVTAIEASAINNNKPKQVTATASPSTSHQNRRQQTIQDGTKVWNPTLFRLLAGHKTETHVSWRDSKENSAVLNVWTDVEDPSHSTTAELLRKRGGAKTFSNQRFVAQGSVWEAPSRGSGGKHPHLINNNGTRKTNNSSSSSKPKYKKNFLDDDYDANEDENDDDDDSASSSVDSEEELNALDPLYQNFSTTRSRSENTAGGVASPSFSNAISGGGGGGVETMLHRITPNTARIDSSNLEPVRYWLSGSNMACLNFQVINDPGLRMNRDLFLSTNGGTGFIPKPYVLWRRQTATNAEINNDPQIYRPPCLPRCNLRIEVLAASMLPPPAEATFNAGSGFSVLIQLILHETKTITTTTGVVLPRTEPPRVVTHRYRTALVQDNLHAPSWDDELWELDVDHPNSAILTVQALACRHEEDLATPMLVGERSIFLYQLQQGVRMVPLVAQDGARMDHPNAGVLCRFSLTPDILATNRRSPPQMGEIDYVNDTNSTNFMMMRNSPVVNNNNNNGNGNGNDLLSPPNNNFSFGTTRTVSNHSFPVNRSQTMNNFAPDL